MNRTYFARATTRALWVGGIAAITLGASRGSAASATLHVGALRGDSVNAAAPADAGSAGSTAASRVGSLMAGLSRDTVYGRSGKLRVRFVSQRSSTGVYPAVGLARVGSVVLAVCIGNARRVGDQIVCILQSLRTERRIDENVRASVGAGSHELRRSVIARPLRCNGNAGANRQS